MESPGKPRGPPAGKTRNAEALKWAMGPPSRTGNWENVVELKALIVFGGRLDYIKLVMNIKFTWIYDRGKIVVNVGC